MFSKPPFTNDCLDDADLAGVALHALDAEDAARCESHLENCAECRNLLAETMAMQEGMAWMCPFVEPPRGFAKTVFKKVLARQSDSARI
jgi:predicted anti-sigma-YlaC factor YlaD